MATSGEIRWPPAGRNDGHQWGIKWPPVGRNRWPLTFVEHKLRYRDREVGGVLRRLASRRCGALAVATVLGGLLIALIWLGLASCAAFTAPVAGEQHLVRGTVGLRADQARIGTLVIELRQAALAGQPPAITAAPRIRVEATHETANPLPQPRRPQ